MSRILAAICASLILFSIEASRPVGAQVINGVNVCFDAIGNPVPAIPNSQQIALATILDGRPVVLYNPSFINRLSRPMQLMVFAHECGHHALGHIVGMALLRAADNVYLEQEADCYGVAQLYNNGLIDNAGVQAIQAELSTWSGDPTHFPGPVRAFNLPKCLDRSNASTASRRAGLGVNPEIMLSGSPDDDAARLCLERQGRDSTFDWNTNGRPPIVRIHVPFRNACDRPIRCRVIFASGYKDLNDATDAWSPYTAVRRTISVAPYTTEIVDATLTWFATATRKPQLHLPGGRAADSAALTRCEYNGVAVASTSSQAQTLPFSSAFPQLAAAASRGFLSIRGQVTSELDDGTKFYASKISISGLSDCEIIGGTSPSYDCKLGEFIDRSEAEASAENLAAKLAATLPSAYKRSTPASAGLGSIKAVDFKSPADADPDIRIWVTKSGLLDSPSFVVRLWIYGL